MSMNDESDLLKNTYLFLAMLGLCCCMGFCLVAVHGLLIVVASLGVKHGLQGSGFNSCGMWAR